MDGWLAASGGGFLRSGEEMAYRLRRYPGVVERTVELAAECAFDFKVIAPKLPDFAVEGDHTEMSWLRHLVRERAPDRYGPPGAERVPGAYAQIGHELDVIDQLGLRRLLPDRARHRGVLRGERASCARAGARRPTRRSATRSALPASIPFSTDCCSSGSCRRAGTARRTSTWTSSTDRREEVIQYVYDAYGRERGGAGRQRDHVPAADGAARRGPGARLLAERAERLVQAGRARGPTGRASRSRPTPGRPRVGDRAGGADAGAAPRTWASTPAGW